MADPAEAARPSPTTSRSWGCASRSTRTRATRSCGLRDDETDVEYPRLVNRHTLGFHTSLLIALLRKRLAEFDATSSDTRLVLGRDQIVEMLRVYLPSSSDDVKTMRVVEGHIRKVEELGFLHPLRGQDDQYEVRRIIRAYVDGQWLGDFDRRIARLRRVRRRRWSRCRRRQRRGRGPW